jgi:hypothetical protein
MRFILSALLLTFDFNYAHAQLQTGTYISGLRSFRTNYFLKVDKDSVTLFGWESHESDTIYFKSSCKKDSMDKLTFTNFAFTRSKPTAENLNTFIGNPKIEIPTFILHRYLFNFQKKNNKVFMLAKDAYDSRADEFEFILLD